MLDAINFFLKYLKNSLTGSESIASYYSRIGDDVIPSLNKNFAEDKEQLWLNLGYWKEAKKYNKACYDLAKLLGEFANLKSGDKLLDAGFGFGDQDFVWINNFDVEHITGINITPKHVKIANKRLSARGLEDEIEFKFGDATDLEYENDVFDKILALESAFHFDTRETFFKEAYRVLTPGGRLATADMIPRPGEKISGFWRRRGRRQLCIPEENVYDKNVYKSKLEKIGFTNVKVKSIADYVFNGARKYFKRRIFDSNLGPKEVTIEVSTADIKAGKGPKIWGWAFGTSDYVLVSAQKPAKK